MKIKISSVLRILIPLAAFAQTALLIAQQADIESKTLSVVWTQKAAEYRALCYQAFNAATMQIDQLRKCQLRKQHLAIITDLDETILDNSYAEVQLILEGKDFNGNSWQHWTDQSAATAVPGAVEFLQHAKRKGLTIFYISNRDVSALQSTLFNLQKLHLPDADTSHIFLLTNTSSKEQRRNRVGKQYKVVMLLGDNLNDFTETFVKQDIATRFAETDRMKAEWGKKFIVLPNCMYGEWENALYGYQHGLTAEQKENMRRALLEGEPSTR